MQKLFEEACKSSTLHGARRWVHLVGKIEVDVDSNDDAYHGYLLAATARHAILVVADNAEEPGRSESIAPLCFRLATLKQLKR